MLPLIPILLVMTVLAADGGLSISLHGESGLSATSVLGWAVGPTGLVIILSAIGLWRAESGVARGRLSARKLGESHPLRGHVDGAVELHGGGADAGLAGRGSGRDRRLASAGRTAGDADADHRLRLPVVVVVSHRTAACTKRHCCIDSIVDCRSIFTLERGPYVSTQLAMHVLMMLVPMLLILAASDVIEHLLLDEEGHRSTSR